VAGIVCLWAVAWLKPMFKYDDALDVFGIHGVGGIVGAIGTGFLAAPELGGFPLDGYSMGSQVWIQIQAVIVAIIWSGVVAFLAMLITKAVMGTRVSESEESDGLDITYHGERAYN
jgi:Amt family ammonium transporter